ncbi:ABC transporter ATP-binding protein [Aeromicrobium choanae]|uniref:ABC-type dipeptide/oligopeptide/nickel transport system, ATPase component n=1 Tax=Aeromicrobium choanae TaxID=1736691 RepID=A0A1T4Z327_9ACTN|nr:ABC transporter ATP-binding protein [Aeromicrobium choanae]SKB08449.1 ABC-type dipeptide/oligopeptide/nickel transport system, ATPase component [Aeromicrobium choanae]
MALLEVSGLTVATHDDRAPALVKGVSFSIEAGEIVGVVGASGSGKTLTALAVAQLLPRTLDVDAHSLVFDGVDLMESTDTERAEVLGGQLAMVFQDPLSSLNPVRHIGSQMIESVRRHRGLSKREALQLAETCLADVGMVDPAGCLKKHPHELSGGMRQRVMIAMGLMGDPRLIVADEPTTALDVTVQAQVIDLIVKINRERGTAVMFVSHNIALLSEFCSRILVMREGKIVEDLSTDALLAGASHPYTRALIRAVPNLTTDRDRELATVDDL